MPRGGARPGAGRKPRAERFARPIAAAEKQIADRLPKIIDQLLLMATGTARRTEERYAAAGTLKRNDVARDPLTGEITLDRRGNPIKVEVALYPDLDPGEMVLVERKEIELGPERAAGEYLTDRILGKPTAVVEQDITTNGQSLAPNIELALAKVYGSEQNPEAGSEGAES